MASLLFSPQRDSSGAAIFSDQLDIAEPEFYSSLYSTAVLLATLSSVANDTSVSMFSVSSVVAALSAIEGPLTLAISSQSEMIVNLEPGVEVYVSCNLTSLSSLVAILYPAIPSNIPRGTKVRAVPVGEDSAQILRYRGDSYADSFTVFDDNTGLHLDINGCTFKMTVANSDKNTATRQLLYTLYGSLDDAENGIVSFSPSESQANLLGYFYYDVEMRDSQGVIRTLISNSYVYKQDITP